MLLALPIFLHLLPRMAFNGNDAVVCSKNERFWLISWWYIQWWNCKLVDEITAEATVMAANKATQWDVFALDTCNNLGVVWLQRAKTTLDVSWCHYCLSIQCGTLLSIIRQAIEVYSIIRSNFQCRKHYQIWNYNSKYCSRNLLGSHQYQSES
jgi:hypothetical protein